MIKSVENLLRIPLTVKIAEGILLAVKQLIQMSGYTVAVQGISNKFPSTVFLFTRSQPRGGC